MLLLSLSLVCYSYIYSSGSSRLKPTFISISFKDWKHATGIKGTLNGHLNSLAISKL